MVLFLCSDKEGVITGENKEFMTVYDGDRYQGWADYVTYGGLPLTVTMKTEEQKINTILKMSDFVMRA